MPNLHIYNTMARQKMLFEPREPGKVKLYCCGPTVYNYAHIGNLRTYVFEDLLRRVLEWNGYQVNHVMNITDVGHLTSDADEGEDKMEKGKRNMLYFKCKFCQHLSPTYISIDKKSFKTMRFENNTIPCEKCHKPNNLNKKDVDYIDDPKKKKTVWEIADFYTQAFLEDMDRLNLLKPHIKPKATDNINTMINQIKKLEENGLTYTANGNVYFDTSKFPNYGKLAQLDKQKLKVCARIEADPNKKDPHDFVLWFTKSKFKDQEMQWESPWGKGYPGWHIECSAMAMKYLGSQMDIHCGGIDHIPVHHTNEIAQAEGATNIKPWVLYWMHGNFLILGKDEKMAKSGENFLTLKALADKGYDPLDYRYFSLQAHYRKELTFSWEGMDAAKTGLRRLREKVCALGATEGTINQSRLEQFESAINDDLNIPQALSLTWDLMDDKNISNADKLATVKKFDTILGLKLDEPPEFCIPDEIQKLADERDKARQEKNWGKSDKLRDEIEEAGFIVKDGPSGTEVMPK